MIVEVLFKDRIGPYHRDQVYFIEDGVFLRAALKTGKAEVVNPPDWDPDYKEPEVVLKPVVEKPKVEETTVQVTKDNEDGANNSQQGSDGESSGEKSSRRKRSRKTSTKRSESDAETSSEGYGEVSELSESTEDSGAGEDYLSDSVGPSPDTSYPEGYNWSV